MLLLIMETSASSQKAKLEKPSKRNEFILFPEHPIDRDVLILTNNEFPSQGVYHRDSSVGVLQA